MRTFIALISTTSIALASNYIPYRSMPYEHQAPSQQRHPESLQIIAQRIINNPKSQELTFQRLTSFLTQQGAPLEWISDIQENALRQKPNWQRVVADCFSELSIKRFLEGMRINPTSDVSNHLREVQQKRKNITWDPDLLGVWIIQSVEKQCNRQRIDLQLLKRDIQNIMRLIPENYRDDLDIESLIQKLESSMIWQTLIKNTSQHLDDPQTNRLKAAQSHLFNSHTHKSPKSPRDPWVIQTFEKSQFNQLKDEKLMTLWRNLQGSTGGFDLVARSIISEIESLSRDNSENLLYQKNMIAFLRGINQQFQEQVQAAPLGIAAWLYNQLDSQLQHMWAAGPHFQPQAFQQWRGDKESLETISLEGIQLSILAGFRDIEAKKASRTQKIQEIQRFLDAWNQRFQKIPDIADTLQSIEGAVDELLDKASVWPILADITSKNMTAKGYQKLMKEFPKTTKIRLSKPWDRAKKIKRAMILPWGKQSREHVNQTSSKSQDNDIFGQLVNQLTKQGTRPNNNTSTQQTRSSNKALDDKTSDTYNQNPNKALEDSIQQFIGALGLKI